jgi:N-ethylmaleimide reductase
VADVNLFSPGRIDGFDTRNRIVMAPMTRCRSDAQGVPTDIVAEYYAQRASAGLIITEGIAPCAVGLGYARTPALESPAQVAAFKKVTDAVHAKGGKIFAQFMHVGRIGHSANRYTKEPLISPSGVRAAGQMWTDSMQMQDNDQPRAIDLKEIPGIIDDYAKATKNAIAAGFDGVELHSASGYLPMQFLSTNTNLRTDAYGGSAANRIRFVVEALEAMTRAAGSASKVGIKISPAMPFNDINDANPVETYTTLVTAIGGMGLAYLHVLQSAPEPSYFKMLRPLFKGPFAAGGGFSKDSGDAMLKSGGADFIVYGKLFTSNPDLPARFQKNAPLADFDANTFYGGGDQGYITYPSL